MGAIVNGLAAHGAMLPYGSTFLIFSDYMRPPIRLAALMRLHVVHVFTHDSIALGEDGPTHQPVEQLAGLRAIPGLTVIRPCDANETAVAWRIAVEARDRPVVLVLSPPGPAHARPHALRVGRARARWRVCAARRAREGPAADPHRQRFGGPVDRCRGGAPASRRRRGTLRVDAKLRSLRRAIRRAACSRAAARGARAARRRSGIAAMGGIGMSVTAATCWRSTGSVRRHRVMW